MKDNQQELVVLVIGMLLVTAVMFRIASCAENEAFVHRQRELQEERR